VQVGRYDSSKDAWRVSAGPRCDGTDRLAGPPLRAASQSPV